MSIATLSVDLVAKLARFEADMGKAARASEKTANQIKGALNTVKVAATALAGVVSVGLFTSLIRGTIDAADELGKLSQRTGVAVETLGGLGYAASLAGGDVESLSSAADKLNKTIAEAAAGEKKASEAFAALGISVKDVAGNTKSFDAVFGEVADKFASYADGPEKVAQAMELMGKSGAEQIVLLNQGSSAIKAQSEEWQRYSGVTTQLTKDSEKFNDTLTKIGLLTSSLGTSIASALLPSLQAVADEFLRVKETGEGFTGVGEAVRDTFNNIAKGAATVIAYLKSLGYVWAGLAATLANPLSAKTIFGFVSDDINRAISDLDRFKRNLAGVGRIDPNDQSAAESRRLGMSGSAKKQSAPRLPSSGGAGSKDKVSDAQKYLENLQKQLEKTKDLSVEEQLLTDIQAKRLGKVSPAMRDQLVAIAQQIDAARALSDLEKDVVASKKKAAEMSRARVDELERENDAYIKGNTTLRESIEEIGLTDSALNALRLTRLADAIAIDEQVLATARNANASAEEIALIEKRINLKRQERGLTEKSQSATREDGLLSGTPTAELEKQRDDMLYLTDLFEKGRIGETQYLEAVTKRLGITNEKLEKTKTLAEELGLTFTSAFEDAIVGGKGLGAVLKGLEQDILRIVTRKLVTDPLGNALTSALGGGGSGDGIGGFLTKAISSIFGGFKADGGPVSAGVPYIVGERGMEMFVPRNSGTIVPNSRMGGNVVSITVNQSFAAGTNRATTMQAAADARRQLEYAGRNL